MKYLKHFSIVHCSVSLLFEGGGLDFAQDGKLNFYLKFNCLKWWAVEYLIFEIEIIFKVRPQSTKNNWVP